MRERQQGKVEKQWSTKGETDKAQRESLSAVNTDTVMQSGPLSLPPSLSRMVHSSHGHTRSVCGPAAVYHENFEHPQSGRGAQHSCLNPRSTCLFLPARSRLSLRPHLFFFSSAPTSTEGHSLKQLSAFIIWPSKKPKQTWNQCKNRAAQD